jgi:hypothetical protein
LELTDPIEIVRSGEHRRDRSDPSQASASDGVLFSLPPGIPMHPSLALSIRRSVVSLLSITISLALGCGGKSTGDKDKGTITGKLTVKGAAPAPGSTIKFTGSDGKEASGGVDVDGTYTVSDVAPGDAKISVTGAASATAVGGAAMPGMATAKGAPIPQKYATPGVIPSFTVKKGENKHDIDLVP